MFLIDVESQQLKRKFLGNLLNVSPKRKESLKPCQDDRDKKLVFECTNNVVKGKRKFCIVKVVRVCTLWISIIAYIQCLKPNKRCDYMYVYITHQINLQRNIMECLKQPITSYKLEPILHIGRYIAVLCRSCGMI